MAIDKRDGSGGQSDPDNCTVDGGPGVNVGREASDAAGGRPDRLNGPDVAVVPPPPAREREPPHGTLCSHLILWEQGVTRVIRHAGALSEAVHPPYHCLWYMRKASLWQVGFCCLGRFETPIRGGGGELCHGSGLDTNAT